MELKGFSVLFVQKISRFKILYYENSWQLYFNRSIISSILKKNSKQTYENEMPFLSEKYQLCITFTYLDLLYVQLQFMVLQSFSSNEERECFHFFKQSSINRMTITSTRNIMESFNLNNECRQTVFKQ